MTNFDFIMDSEIEKVEDMTQMTRDEVLGDYVLYCKYADLEIGFDSWSEYMDETENQF